jgi:hypothetical protein
MTRVKIEKEEVKTEVREVKTVASDVEANELLTKGWVLLASGVRHIDQLGYNTKTYFTLGRIK